MVLAAGSAACTMTEQSSLAPVLQLGHSRIVTPQGLVQGSWHADFGRDPHASVGPMAVLADGDLMTALSEGDGDFGLPERHEVPLPGLYAAVADVTADGWGDVVVCADDGLSMLLNDGAGGLDESLLMAHDLGGACRPTPVDLDGDGVDELLVSAPAALGWYLLRTCPP